MLETISQIVLKILDMLKGAAALLFVRRATTIESERDALKKSTEIQQRQAEIDSHPADRPSAVRERMRQGDL